MEFGAGAFHAALAFSGGAARATIPAALFSGYAVGLALATAGLRSMFKYRRRLRDLERRDLLTGLANRGEFDRLLAEAVDCARADSSRIGVISVDLDGFKQVNDIRGRRTGDIVLAAIAGDLAAAITVCGRGSATVARIGGDQFAVLITRCEGRGEAISIGNKVLSAVRESAMTHSPGIPITASAGVSLFPEHSLDGPTLVRMADIAMYQSKSRNGDCSIVFDSSMNGVDFGSSVIVGMLRNALEENRLRVLYQPILDARGGAVLMEALVRIDNAEAGLLSPTEFIPVAEQTGFIREIGRTVMRRACRQSWIWRGSGFDVRIAVNVSAVELETPSFAYETERIAEEEGAEPETICIEITESAMIRDPGTAEKNLSDLRAAGFSIAMDDFGTGYSSLNMLHRLPLDHLKIDRSFSSAIAGDGRMRTVVEKTVQLAHDLGMRVIAEGIEETAQLDAARAIGCDYFQGYLFAVPVPAERATALLYEAARRSDLLRLENALGQSEFQGVNAGACDARDREKIETSL